MMPSVPFLILATLAAMATTASAAPALPNIDVPIGIKNPLVVTRAPQAVIDPDCSEFTPILPIPHPDIVNRAPAGPTVYIPPIKDPSGDIIARAPGLPKWPPPYEGTWPESSPGIVARAPAPAATDVTGQIISPVYANYTVHCGCWNMCTLEQTVNTDIVCEETCDPQYQCDAVPIATDIIVKKRDSSDATHTKRDVGSIGKRGGAILIIVVDGAGNVIGGILITM